MKLKSIKEEMMHKLSSKSSSSSEVLLPHDVIIEILLRLPAKSVFRFKYVCKDWFSLIISPEFIKMHLHHSTAHGENNPSSLFIFSKPMDVNIWDLSLSQLLIRSVFKLKDPSVSIHSVDYNFIDDDDASRVVKINNIPPPIKSAGSGFKCLGSCNGLLASICSQTKERDVLCLWNPCTEEYREIIPPKQPSKLYDTTTTTTWTLQDTTYGFGYDPTMGDYKVLANACYVYWTEDDRGPGGYVFHYKIVANVYNLGTNSWRNIGEYPYQLFENHGVLVGSALYWRARNSVSNLDIIICFDLADEEYTEIPIPRFISHRYGGNGPMSYSVKLDLREFKGCLAIYPDCIFWEATAEVWVLMTTRVDSINVKEEGGVSWLKLFTISDIQLVLEYRLEKSMWLEPGICKADCRFLMVREWKDLYWYNPTDDKKTKRILVDTHGDLQQMFTSVLTYTENLASLNPHNTRLTGRKEENEQQQQPGIKVENGKSKTRRFLARLFPRCYCYGC